MSIRISQNWEQNWVKEIAWNQDNYDLWYIKVSMVETNLGGKVIIKISQIAVKVETVNIVASHTHGEIAQHMGRNAKNVAKITTSKLYVKVVMLTLINAIQADPDPRKARVKEKSFTKLLKLTMTWMILQIKSNLYSTMMFISIVSTQECTLNWNVNTSQLENQWNIQDRYWCRWKSDANHDVH